MIQHDIESPHCKVVVSDLDDTLFRSDLLWESVASLLSSEPWVLFLLPYWLLVGGRPRLKLELAVRSKIDFAVLPYNKGVVAYLTREKAKGRTLILATASHQLLADKVADHLAIFDQVIATSGRKNMKGVNKLNAIKGVLGDAPFEYIGDSSADLAIWKEAVAAKIVGNRILPEAIRESSGVPVSIETISPDVTRTLKELIKLARPHQWVKNVLVFIPLLAAHAIFKPQLFIVSCLAFVAFSLTASFGYIINDICDVSADRHHTKKRSRPLAAGTVSFPTAIVTLALLIMGAGAAAYTLPPSFILILAAYFVTTLSYSFFLKTKAILDVVFLAGLYVIRIIGGHEATGLAYSPWLLIFSMFFFSSLAFIKRYSELRSLEASSKDKIKGRGYMVSDITPVMNMGVSSGYLSLLVLAQYIYSDQVVKLYSTPQILWLLMPIFLYWISRMWILAGRDEMHHDPVVFAITDKVSLLIGALSLLVVACASLF